MDASRILMLEVAEQVAAVTLVSHLPGIQAVSHRYSQAQLLWFHVMLEVAASREFHAMHWGGLTHPLPSPFYCIPSPQWQVHLLDPDRPGQPQRLQTEGINFAGLWEQQLLLDVNK
jgi:hypothetical protein